MRHLDLFSGIGGFALATEMVWENVEHTFCDIEPFSQAVLRHHWPNAVIYGDIRSLTADSERLRFGRECAQSHMVEHANKSTQHHHGQRQAAFDLLTGGFPCQPFSQAGSRKGTADDRYLWPEMLRVIREFSPRWIIGENVGGFVTWNNGMVFEQVCTDLEAAGYEVQAFIIPACAVDAPHRRDRIWIVAHYEIGDDGRHNRKSQARQDEESGKGNGISNAPDATRRRRGQRNAQRSGIQKGKGAMGQQEWGGSADANSNGRWDKNWSEVAARLCRVDDGIPKRLDRASRLKALGNAIVPQVAAEIMRAIKAVDV